MAGRRDLQELGEPLHDAHDQRLDEDVHQVRCGPALPPMTVSGAATR
jgi:hypothetical protein